MLRFVILPFALLLHLSSFQAAAQTSCPSLPFPLIKAVICVCLLIAVWSGREDVYCTECIHPGKVGCPPLLRSLRLRTVGDSRTTQSGCVRHCLKHTVGLFWHPISLWREQIWEGKSDKSLQRSRITNRELVTNAYSTFLNVFFVCLRSVLRGGSDPVSRDHSNTSQIWSWDSDPPWELFSPSTPVNLPNTTSLFFSSGLFIPNQGCGDYCSLPVTG